MNATVRRVSIALGLLSLAIVPCLAPLITHWSLREISQAPVLLVGRVEKVTRGVELPKAEQKFPYRVEDRLATIEVLRLYTADERAKEAFAASRTVQIAYCNYVPETLGGIMSGPIWPQVEEGDVRLFPLQEGPEGYSKLRLIHEEGIGLMPPARPSDPSAIQAPTPYEFVLREIANVLSSGEPKTILEGSVHLRDSFSYNYQELTSADSATPLAAMISVLAGDNPVAYEELAAGLLAAHGIPRPTLSELVAQDDDPETPRPASFRLTRWALLHIPEEVRQDRLIETLVRNTPVYAWGAAASLSGFAEEPFLLSELTMALRKRQPGSLQVASALINKGQRAVLADSVPFALELLDPPDGDWNDLAVACRIVRDYGSDSNFGVLLAAIRKYQATDLARYQKLWNCAAYSEDNPREIEVLALYLPDRRIVFGSVRFRDLAAARLQQLSGEDFGYRPEPPEPASAQREELAVKAENWLAEQIRLGNVPLRNSP